MFDALLPAQPMNEPVPKKMRETSDATHSKENDNQINFDEELDLRNELLEAVYIQACYCSLGATLEARSRIAFDDFMKKTSGLMMVEDTPEKPATTRNMHIYNKLLITTSNF